MSARRRIGPNRSLISPSHKAIETNTKLLVSMPSEDTYIRDVSRTQVFDYLTHELEITHTVTGGTASTSIYTFDQGLHRYAIGASSDREIIIGSAASKFHLHRTQSERQLEFEDWGGTFDYAQYNLNSPASRGIFHYDLGLDSGDRVVRADIVLEVRRLLTHSFPLTKKPLSRIGGQKIGYTRGHYTIDRICRNDSQVTSLGARAASAGISAGSMEAMGWYRFKGGVLTKSGINLNNFDDGEKWGQSGGSSASNKLNPADTFDTTSRDGVGFSGPRLLNFIADGEANSSDKILTIEVTDLVKNAVEAQDSNLSIMIQRQNDTDGTTAEYQYLGPTIGGSDISDSGDNPIGSAVPVGLPGGVVPTNNTYFPNFTGAMVIEDKPKLLVQFADGHRMVY